ncbi:MAG: hypothetical protein H0W89_03710 [Candidatus Levybacteria bacterium]|nr:hypothetical protein [Candidatus Levybacteria bacterium]
MQKFVLSLLTLLTFFFTVLPTPAYAQFQDWGGCTQTVAVPGGGNAQIATLNCLPVVFSNVVNALLMFVGTVAVVFIVYAGIQLVMSGGDPKKVAAARQIITYALLGLVLVLLSFFIIAIISYTTGVDCIRTFSFTDCK